MSFERGTFVRWHGQIAEIKAHVGASVWIRVQGLDRIVSQTSLEQENVEHLPQVATIQLPADCGDDDGA